MKTYEIRPPSVNPGPVEEGDFERGTGRLRFDFGRKSGRLNFNHVTRVDSAMIRTRRPGLSIVEVLVVFLILVVLVGLLLPATRSRRVASTRAQCQNNMKQIMLGLINYESLQPSPGPPDSSGDFSNVGFPAGCLGVGTIPEERLSWMVAVLPQIEEDKLWRRFDVEKPFAENCAAADTNLRIFACREGPKLDRGATTHYVAMAGVGRDAASRTLGESGNGIMGYDRITRAGRITDGTSNTIALVETRSDLGPWARGGSSNLRGYEPENLPLYGEGRPFGAHNVILAAFADGSVRYLQASVDPKALAAAITIAGGETFDLD